MTGAALLLSGAAVDGVSERGERNCGSKSARESPEDRGPPLAERWRRAKYSRICGDPVPKEASHEGFGAKG